MRMAQEPQTVTCSCLLSKMELSKLGQTKAASSTQGKRQNRLVSFYPSTRTASVTTVITCLNFRPIVKVPCQWAMCWRTLVLERPLTSVTVLVGTVLSHMLTTSFVTVPPLVLHNCLPL